MKRAVILGLILLVAACKQDESTGPGLPVSGRILTAAAANDDGPPSTFPRGSDTYHLGLFTGTGPHKLNCVESSTGGRECNGFLRSEGKVRARR